MWRVVDAQIKTVNVGTLPWMNFVILKRASSC